LFILIIKAILEPPIYTALQPFFTQLDGNATVIQLNKNFLIIYQAHTGMYENSRIWLSYLKIQLP
jgi:hypothetical protein